jgi:hypothetical protein
LYKTHSRNLQRAAYREARTTKSSERRYTSERMYHGAPDADAIETAAHKYLAQRERLRSGGRRILHQIV